MSWEIPPREGRPLTAEEVAIMAEAQVAIWLVVNGCEGLSDSARRSFQSTFQLIGMFVDEPSHLSAVH